MSDELTMKEPSKAVWQFRAGRLWHNLESEAIADRMNRLYGYEIRMMMIPWPAAPTPPIASQAVEVAAIVEAHTDIGYAYRDIAWIADKPPIGTKLYYLPTAAKGA